VLQSRRGARRRVSYFRDPVAPATRFGGHAGDEGGELVGRALAAPTACGVKLGNAEGEHARTDRYA
jgi:hypothetical protein